LLLWQNFERDIIRETMLENRIARGKRGIPTSGKLPFARKFNKETGEWTLDEEAARLIRWAADEYLKGVSLWDLAQTLKTRYKQPLGYKNLLTVLSKRCGDTWTVNFKDEEPITYKIPRILDDNTIQKVKDRLEHNRTNNRKDVRKYTLSGFIHCEACGKFLYGQILANISGSPYQYYHHPRYKYEKCKAFNTIPLKLIENAVFKTIFENTVDAPAFEQAIQESMPDEKLIKYLEKQVKSGEKELKKIEKELDRLVDLALSGTLKKDTISSKEKELLQTKAKAAEELEANRTKLKSLPDIDRVRKEAEDIRRQLLEHFHSEEHLQEMSFDEKKRLLHWLFDGKDKEGTPYGIYIAKRGHEKWDYFLYGRITGLRTIKGDDISYQGWDEDENKYKTNNLANILTPHQIKM
jgi:hypothetical protein